MDGAHVRTLERALETLGNKHQLAIALKISPRELDVYLAGEKPLPPPLFIGALNIVAGTQR